MSIPHLLQMIWSGHLTHFSFLQSLHFLITRGFPLFKTITVTTSSSSSSICIGGALYWTPCVLLLQFHTCIHYMRSPTEVCINVPRRAWNQQLCSRPFLTPTFSTYQPLPFCLLRHDNGSSSCYLDVSHNLGRWSSPPQPVRLKSQAWKSRPRVGKESIVPTSWDRVPQNLRMVQNWDTELTWTQLYLCTIL